MFPEAIAIQFLKFLNIPVCLGTYSDYDALADECTTYSDSEAIEKLEDLCINQKKDTSMVEFWNKKQIRKRTFFVRKNEL